MTVPTFAIGYANKTTGEYRWVPLRQLIQHTTVAKLHPEHRRRVVAVLLYAYDVGVPGGIGTGWRSPTQQAGTVGGAAVWSSWHQGESPKNDTNALAVDTVPNGLQHWSVAIPGRLGMFGLVAFKSSTDSRYWNHQGRSYVGTQEFWHWQPWEINYGRSRYLGPTDLMRWSIPARYDIDVVDLDDPFGTGDVDPPPPVDPPPVVVPPAPTEPVRTTMQIVKTTLDPATRPQGNDTSLFQIYANGLFAAGLVIDGDYGPKTVEAAKVAQAFAGNLTVDGVVGPKSWGEFLNADGN